MHLSSCKLYNPGKTATQKSSFSAQFLVSFSVYIFFHKQLRRYNFLKAAFNIFSLTNPSPDEGRERDRSRDICKEKGDIDDESDVELDGNDELDLDLD